MNRIKSFRLKCIGFIILFLILIPITSNVLLNGSKSVDDSKNQRNDDITKRSELIGDIEILTPKDSSYESPMKGYYLATYGFENDANNTYPSEWSVKEPEGTSVKVIIESGAHKNIAQMYDNSTSNYLELKNKFENRENGTIEFWLKLSDTNSTGRSIYITNGMEPEENFLYIEFGADGRISCQNGDSLELTNFFVSEYRWNHLKINFECTSGWQLWLDGEIINKDQNFDFYGAPVYLNTLLFKGGDADTIENYMYIDAVGYDWKEYKIGDNLHEGLLLDFEPNPTYKYAYFTYSLDGQENIAIRGDSVIPMPSDGLHSIQVFAKDDNNNIHKSDIETFTVETLKIMSPENKYYPDPMDGYFLATYGFENDELGNSPLGWISEEPSGTAVQVINEIDRHKNVVELYDNSEPYKPKMTNEFSKPQIEGTIEFWLRVSDHDVSRYISIYEKGINYGIHLKIDEDETILYFNNDQIYQSTEFTLETEVWHHINIIFNCNENWDILIDQSSISGGFGFSFYGNPLVLNYLSFSGKGSDSGGYTIFIDAIGYDWEESYNAGDNLKEGILLDIESSIERDLNVFEYVLDEQERIEILGDVVIPMPSDGEHSIQVFANDIESNSYKSEIMSFQTASLKIVSPINNSVNTNTGQYPATYSFTEDEIGSNPSDWIIDETGGPLNIIKELSGHCNVIEMHDTNAGGIKEIWMENDFSDQTYGTIEFWFRTDNTLHNHIFTIHDGTNILVYLQVANNQFGYWDSTLHSICSASTNSWYHVRIDFCLDSSGYNSLSADKYFVYINGTKYGVYPFYLNNDGVGADKLKFWTSTSDSNYYTYIDAVGYSWDPDYIIGKNTLEDIKITYTVLEDVNLVNTYYILDGQNSQQIPEYQTIPRPSDGQHSLQIFGYDSLVKFYQSDIYDFSIASLNNITFLTDVTDGNYIATYSFTEDEIGSNPSDWIIDETGGPLNIIKELSGHCNVIEMHDTNAGGIKDIWMENDFSDQTYGTIEFWFRTDNTLYNHIFTIHDGTNILIYLQVANNQFGYWDSTLHSICSASPNSWYHVRIDFCLDSSGYKSLSADRFFVCINSIRHGEYSFYQSNNGIGADKLIFWTSTSDSNYYTYIDAVGYSWDPEYDIGDNLIQNLIPDYRATYSFTEDEIGSNPSDWIIDETGGTLNIIKELSGHYNVIEMHDTNAGGIKDIWMKNDFSDQTYGTIEFWFRTDNTLHNHIFTIHDGTNILVYLEVNDYQFGYWDTTLHSICSASPNSWYHVRIDFCLDSSGYKSLSADRFFVCINSIRYGEYSFLNNNNGVGADKLMFCTSTSDSNYYTYIDAVGYSWDPEYDIGDNSEPGIEIRYGRQSYYAPHISQYSIDGEYNQEGLIIHEYNLLDYGWHTIQIFIEDNYGTYYQSYKQSFFIYKVSLLEWLSPEENYELIFDGTFPDGDPRDNLANFTFSFKKDSSISSVKLILNNELVVYDIYEEGDDGTYYANVTLNWDDYYDNTNKIIEMTIVLKGYSETEEELKAVNRNVKFRLKIGEVNEKLESGVEFIGEKLYLILHDPNGDGSYSGFEDGSTLSIGIGVDESHGFSAEHIYGDYLFVSVECGPVDIGSSAGATVAFSTEITTEGGFDFRYETSDLTSITSNVESDDADYIGPGYGDRYWGEAWMLNWKITANVIIYADGEVEYFDPVLVYNILRDSEVFLNDQNAPNSWKELNPVHTGYSSEEVEWIDTKVFDGPATEGFTYSQSITSSYETRASIEIRISNEFKGKIPGFEDIFKLDIITKNYWEESETSYLERSFTLNDDDAGDIIAQRIGIDKRFGTFIFQNIEGMSLTTDPYEHNTEYDAPPEFIGMPTIQYDTNGDGKGPCSNDKPKVITEIHDNGDLQLVLLNYSTDSGIKWYPITMTEQPGNPGFWEAYIDNKNHTTTVEWHLIAWNEAGNKAYKFNAYNNNFQYTVMNSAPTLELESPVGGELFKEIVEINWTCSDVDKDDITFSLYYDIANTGWHYIGTGIQGEYNEEDIIEVSYKWNVSTWDYTDNVVIRIRANDGYGGVINIENEVVFAIDNENHIPIINNPNDVSYDSGETGNIIEWQVTDDDVYLYNIYRNDILILSISGEGDGIGPLETITIEVNVDDLDIGLYEYKIEVKDLSYFTQTDIVIVTVS